MFSILTGYPFSFLYFSFVKDAFWIIYHLPLHHPLIFFSFHSCYSLLPSSYLHFYSFTYHSSISFLAISFIFTLLFVYSFFHDHFVLLVIHYFIAFIHHQLFFLIHLPFNYYHHSTIKSHSSTLCIYRSIVLFTNDLFKIPPLNYSYLSPTTITVLWPNPHAQSSTFVMCCMCHTCWGRGCRGCSWKGGRGTSQSACAGPVVVEGGISLLVGWWLDLSADGLMD